MARTELMRALGALADDSSAALTRGADESELSERYVELQRRAVALNRQHGWATDAELATVLPTLESLRAIESLDLALGQSSVPGPPVDRGTTVRLQEAVAQLAAWATGMKLAYETLELADADQAGD